MEKNAGRGKWGKLREEWREIKAGMEGNKARGKRMVPVGNDRNRPKLFAVESFKRTNLKKSKL
jgi:hypothetical protein